MTPATPRPLSPASRLSAVLAVLVLLAPVASPARADAGGDPDRWLEERIERAERAVDDEPTFEHRLLLAKLLHLKGSHGNKGAAKRSDRMFQALREDHGDDPRVLAYAGSAMMLRAKRAWLPWKKGALVEDGGELITRAMALAERTPEADETEVRFVRAVSVANLPGWMEQEAVAKRDFEALAASAEQAVRDGRLSQYQAASALVHRAGYLADADREAEARELYRRAIELSPKSHAAAAAREALEDL